MIQITQTTVTVPPEGVEALQTEFAETGCAMMPGFLTPGVLSPLMKQLEKARFETRNEVFLGNGNIFGTTSYMPQTEPAVKSLNFFLNRSTLYGLAAQIAGTPVLRNFLCRLHRTAFGTGQHIDWHDDAVDYRTLGLNINLSDSAYTGGEFQLRSPDGKIEVAVSRWSPGDAFLFRIGYGWQHRLTPVESGQRTVGVGWFRTEPDWQLLTGASLRTRMVMETGGIG